MLFCLSLKAKVQRLATRTITGELLFLLLSASYMKWSYSIRLKTYALQNNLFSDVQSVFQEGVSCIEGSFTILESINHMLERGSEIFSCSLDICKAFDTVWIDDLLFRSFREFGVKGQNVARHQNLVH